MNWVISGIQDTGAALRPTAARGAHSPDSGQKCQLFPARTRGPASLPALAGVLGSIPCWTVSFSEVGVGADTSCIEPMRSAVVTAGCGEGGGTGTAVSLRQGWRQLCVRRRSGSAVWAQRVTSGQNAQLRHPSAQASDLRVKSLRQQSSLSYKLGPSLFSKF